jgi:transposase-like protein
MRKISYARYRFLPSIIQRAVWLYFRFPLSFRDVEEMLAERGIDVSYETIRRWILKFGPAIAANVRTRRVQPSGTWHHDEVFVRIGGKRTYLWRGFVTLTQLNQNSRRYPRSSSHNFEPFSE